MLLLDQKHVILKLDLVNKTLDQSHIDNTSLSVGSLDNQFFQSVKLIDLVEVNWRNLVLLRIWVVNKLTFRPIVKNKLGYFSNNVKLFLEDD